MRQAVLRQSPAMLVAILALFLALGGGVYAASKARINGKSIRAKSIPGNRLKPRSVPANRLKPGVIPAALQAAPLTGRDIQEATLGRVPSAGHANVAGHAETAGHAASAGDAQTALNAVNAEDAKRVNGYSAGCQAGLELFAGACWERSASVGAATAPLAAAECANRGGALPDALTLAAFAERGDINLHAEDEWSSDVTNVSGPDAFGVVTVADDGEISFTSSTETRHYRCVVPLVS